MIQHMNRHRRLFKIIATGVVCLFLVNTTCQSVSYAYPANNALATGNIGLNQGVTEGDLEPFKGIVGDGEEFVYYGLYNRSDAGIVLTDVDENPIIRTNGERVSIPTGRTVHMGLVWSSMRQTHYTDARIELANILGVELDPNTGAVVDETQRQNFEITFGSYAILHEWGHEVLTKVLDALFSKGITVREKAAYNKLKQINKETFANLFAKAGLGLGLLDDMTKEEAYVRGLFEGYSDKPDDSPFGRQMRELFCDLFGNHAVLRYDGKGPTDLMAALERAGFEFTVPHMRDLTFSNPDFPDTYEPDPDIRRELRMALARAVYEGRLEGMTAPDGDLVLASHGVTTNQTVLHEWHIGAKAKMGPFGGYDMPLEYGPSKSPDGKLKGRAAEHWAVRSDAGMFDIGHMGLMDITGENALPFLQKVLTNQEVSRLKTGGALYSFIADEDGTIIDDVLVYRLGHNRYRLVVNAVNTDRFKTHLNKHITSRVDIAHPNDAAHAGTRSTAIALQGPRSLEVLNKLKPHAEVPLEDMKYFTSQGAWLTIGRRRFRVLISRTGYTGERGFEIFGLEDQIKEVWQALHDEGVMACGLVARDSLRLEAGLPLYGHEIEGEEGISPFEAGFGDFVSEDGDYMGREALMDRKAKANRRVINLLATGRVEGEINPAKGGIMTGYKDEARPASVIKAKNKNGEWIEVGRVTSSAVRSPTWRPEDSADTITLALGCVSEGFARPGTEFKVETTRGTGEKARTQACYAVAMPTDFYDRAGDRFAREHIPDYIPITDEERAEMLKVIGVQSAEELFETIPKQARYEGEFDLPPPMNRMELFLHMLELSRKNMPATAAASFLGGGIYNNMVPDFVDLILSLPEAFSPYTPYQAEEMQGELEDMFAFQSLVCNMTGMDVANASLYDGGSAVAEAALMAARYTTKMTKKERRKIVIAGNLNPYYKRVLHTYLQNAHLKKDKHAKEKFTLDIVEVGIDPQTGQVDLDRLKKEIDDDTACVIVQQPNFLGCLETGLQEIADAAHQSGAVLAVSTNLSSLAQIQPPSEYGADIVIAEAQPLGNHMNFGGPGLGVLALKWDRTKDRMGRRSLLGQMPGRVVGRTVDKEGRPCFDLVYDTREQHIEREDATSNICTNEALMALRTAAYLLWMASDGALEKSSRHSHSMAVDAMYAIAQIPGFRPVFTGNIFNEFTLASAVPIDELNEKLEKKGIIGGLNVSEVVSQQIGREGHFTLLAFTDLTTPGDVKKLVQVLREISEEGGLKSDVLPGAALPEKKAFAAMPEGLGRTDIAEAIPAIDKEKIRDYFFYLISRNYGIESGLQLSALLSAVIPLGSCTVKYNPFINEIVAAFDGFLAVHPHQRPEITQGTLQMMYELERDLCEISGFHGVSLQPAAGAQGEFTGLQVMQAYHADKKHPEKDVILVPASAHGTNPASAAMSGYDVVEVAMNDDGTIDLASLDEKMKENEGRVAGIMMTNPNTLGLFEDNIAAVYDRMEEIDALLYMDGANMNAFVGKEKPAKWAHVMQFNLHKTFSTPHGGGGPGAGPVGVAEKLARFLPTPVVEHDAGKGYYLVDRSDSIGQVHASFGNIGVAVKAYAYIRALGAAGLRRVAENAVINANYMMARLKGYYALPFAQGVHRMHEFVISPTKEMVDKANAATQEKITADELAVRIAKRLHDYGLHPPTVCFPLIVHGALMIEPTETATKAWMDNYCKALIEIAEDLNSGDKERIARVLNAPAGTKTPIRRSDKFKGSKELNLASRDIRGLVEPVTVAVDAAAGKTAVDITCRYGYGRPTRRKPFHVTVEAEDAQGLAAALQSGLEPLGLDIAANETPGGIRLVRQLGSGITRTVVAGFDQPEELANALTSILEPSNRLRINVQCEIPPACAETLNNILSPPQAGENPAITADRVRFERGLQVRMGAHNERVFALRRGREVVVRRQTSDATVVGSAMVDYVVPLGDAHEFPSWVKVEDVVLAEEGQIDTEMAKLAETVGADLKKTPGGTGAAQAIALSLLGAEDVTMITSLGGEEDEDANALVEFMKAGGVNTSHIRRVSDKPTARTFVPSKGTHMGFMHEIGADAELTIEDIPDERYQRQIFHIGGIAVNPGFARNDLLTALKRAKQEGAVTVMDMVVDPLGVWQELEDAGVSDAICEHLDVLTMGEREIGYYTDLEDPAEIVEYFLNKGVKTVIYKMGENGCMVASRNSPIFADTAEPVQMPVYSKPDYEVVDGTGMGDAFSAAVSSAILRGFNLGETVAFATAVASLAGEQVGGGGDIGPEGEQGALGRFDELTQKANVYAAMAMINENLVQPSPQGTGVASSSAGSLVGQHRGEGSVNDEIAVALLELLVPREEGRKGELVEQGRVSEEDAERFLEWWNGEGEYAGRGRNPGDDVPEELWFPLEKLSEGRYIETADGERIPLICLAVDNFGMTKEDKPKPITAHIGLSPKGKGKGERKGSVAWLALGVEDSLREEQAVELDKMHEGEEKTTVLSNPDKVGKILIEAVKWLKDENVREVSRDEVSRLFRRLLVSKLAAELSTDYEVNLTEMAKWLDETSDIAQVFSHIAHREAWQRIADNTAREAIRLRREWGGAVAKSRVTDPDRPERGYRWDDEMAEFAALSQEAENVNIAAQKFLRGAKQIPRPVEAAPGTGIALTSHGEASPSAQLSQEIVTADDPVGRFYQAQEQDSKELKSAFPELAEFEKWTPADTPEGVLPLRQHVEFHAQTSLILFRWSEENEDMQWFEERGLDIERVTDLRHAAYEGEIEELFEDPEMRRLWLYIDLYHDCGKLKCDTHGDAVAYHAERGAEDIGPILEDAEFSENLITLGRYIVADHVVATQLFNPKRHDFPLEIARSMVEVYSRLGIRPETYLKLLMLKAFVDLTTVSYPSHEFVISKGGAGIAQAGVQLNRVNSLLSQPGQLEQRQQHAESLVDAADATVSNLQPGQELGIVVGPTIGNLGMSYPEFLAQLNAIADRYGVQVTAIIPKKKQSIADAVEEYLKGGEKRIVRGIIDSTSGAEYNKRFADVVDRVQLVGVNTDPTALYEIPVIPILTSSFTGDMGSLGDVRGIVEVHRYEGNVVMSIVDVLPRAAEEIKNPEDLRFRYRLNAALAGSA